MAIAVSIIGIAAAVLAEVAGRPLAIYAVAAPGLLGLLFVGMAMVVGADQPKAAATLYLGGMLIPLAIGAGAAALGIWATSEISGWQGADAPPWNASIGGAMTAVVALIVERAGALDGLMPSALARWGVQRKYVPCFPRLEGGDTATFKLAYEAIHRPNLSDSNGSITGWKWDATRRRLELIAAGISELDASSPCKRS